MSLINKLWDIATAADWVSPAVDIYRLKSNNWETIDAQAHWQTPNQVAKEHGPEWKVGYVDYDTGAMTLHRKKR